MKRMSFLPVPRTASLRRAAFLLTLAAALMGFTFLPLPHTAVPDKAPAPADAPAPAVRSLLENMIRAVDGIKTLSGRQKRTERIGKEMVAGDMRFKLQVNPHKIYIYNMEPAEGSEVIWAKGWNGDKALINPNQFPWVNLSMDIMGSTMLDEQHHCMTNTGFDCPRRIAKQVLAHYPQDLEQHVTYGGRTRLYGQDADIVNIHYHDYGFVNYTVKTGDDLLKLDSRLTIPAWKILELNPDLDGFMDVPVGKVIRIPNVYAREIRLLLDPVTFLPIGQVIKDEQGLFEMNEYYELKVNPTFTALDFSPDNPNYGF